MVMPDVEINALSYKSLGDLKNGDVSAEHQIYKQTPVFLHTVFRARMN
jgi:hypothetical protein